MRRLLVAMLAAVVGALLVLSVESSADTSATPGRLPAVGQDRPSDQ